jgi:hypothetical protein
VWNLESRVLPVLAKMRSRGIRIDQTKLGEIEQWSIKQEREACDKIKAHTGYDMPLGGVWKPKLVADTLAKIGVSYWTPNRLKQLRRYHKGPWTLHARYHCKHARQLETAVLRRLRVERMMFVSTGSVEIFRTSGRVVEALLHEEAERLGLELFHV